MNAGGICEEWTGSVETEQWRVEGQVAWQTVCVLDTARWLGRRAVLAREHGSSEECMN